MGGLVLRGEGGGRGVACQPLVVVVVVWRVEMGGWAVRGLGHSMCSKKACVYGG